MVCSKRSLYWEIRDQQPRADVCERELITKHDNESRSSRQYNYPAFGTRVKPTVFGIYWILNELLNYESIYIRPRAEQMKEQAETLISAWTEPESNW